MKAFKDISGKELSDLIHSKEPFKINISSNIVDFPSNMDFSKAREIPPTSIILTKEGLAQVMVRGGNDVKGLHMQFVVFVYAFGGKIFYQKEYEDNYVASVVWPNTLQAH